MTDGFFNGAKDVQQCGKNADKVFILTTKT